MPSVRRIKSVKWDEDDLDDYYSEDYSDEDYEDLSNLKVSNNKSPKIAIKSNVSPKTNDNKPICPTPKSLTFCNPKRFVSETKNHIDSSNHRYPLNVVVLGAVDAGKSTLLGHFLTLTGCVDKKLKNLKHLSWIMDQGEDERDRGITIDPTKCQFNLSLTNLKHFTNNNNNLNQNSNNNSNTNHSNLLPYDHIKVNVIDTPGHHDLIQNLVMGAVFANSAVIIVDSNDVLKSDIFGVYFSEHMLLLYFLGIRHYVICVNKIDRFKYAQDMYNKVVEIIKKLVKSYEKSITLLFLPVSGLNGDNLVSKSCNLEWYNGPTLIESLQLFAIDIIKRPVVIYDKVVCHIFDLWESGKNTICCSCFVEGNKMKVPADMFTLPNSVQIKCTSVNYQELNFIDSNNLETSRSNYNNNNNNKDNNNNNNNEYNSSRLVNNTNNNSYVNDFVDCVEMKGTEISNLVTSKIMIDYNTHSKIRNNTSSIVKTNTFVGFIYLNKMNKNKLSIGQSVELYVGYTKQSANIRTLEVVEDYKTLRSKKMYTLVPGEFAFMEFTTYLPILVEPISRKSNFIYDIVNLFYLSENKNKNYFDNNKDNNNNTENKEYKENKDNKIDEIEHVGILSRLLVRSNGSFIAGGVVVNNK